MLVGKVHNSDGQGIYWASENILDQCGIHWDSVEYIGTVEV